MRCMSRAASNECPPSSKKLSRIPTGFLSRTVSQIFVSFVSSSFAGATYSWVAAKSAAFGAGNARLSTLPFGVFGMASSRTTAAGTM